MRSKKAMSPLIATVLLIAFAVALGAMIMNWSTDIDSSSEGGGDQEEDLCAGVRMELNRAFGKQILCYQDGAIKFNVVNTGNKEISGIQIRTFDEDINEVKEDVQGSRIPRGETFEYEFPSDANGKVHAELVPFVIDGSNKEYCISQKIVNDLLPSCSAE